MKRVLCIWFPNWPIQRLVVDRRELERRVIILHARDPRRGQRVVACSRLAAKQGIRIDMPLAEATSIGNAAGDFQRQAGQWKDEAADELPAKQNVYTLPYDPEADLEVLAKLAARCDRFSPLVGLEANDPPEGLLLDTTNLAELFGGEAKLACQVAEFLRGQRYLPKIAMADTIGAAWAAVRGSVETGTVTATVGAGNNGIVIFPAGCTRQLLDPLPIWTLRLPEQTIDLLHRLGIQRIGQLIQLPRDGLSARFGDQLLHRIDQALGLTDETIFALEAPLEFEANWTLEHPTARRETIQQIVLQLMRQLSKQLLLTGRGALQIECHLDCSERRTIRIQIGLFQPRADADHLMGLAAMQLDTLALPGPAYGIRVKAISTARLSVQQQELWTDRHRDSPQQLARLVERLSSRLGQQRVLSARLQPAIQPERTCRYVALTGQQTANRQSAHNTKPNASTSRMVERPLWMPALPLPLELISVSPDGPPICFHHAGRRHEVHRHWGPERIETAWWRGRCVRRDYYRVETTQGDRFWLFRRLTDHAWFLHGFLG